MKSCKVCRLLKPVMEFHVCGTYKNKVYYRGECIECNNKAQRTIGKKYTKKYRATEKYKETKRKFRSTEEQKRKAKEYSQRPEVKSRRNELALKNVKRRYKTDLLFRLKVSMRTRLHEILCRYNHSKRGKTFDYLGCDVETLKKHLEIQFKEGMSWNNYGSWHIDHIIPLSSAKDEKELIKLFHYTNLQPLWAIDNLRKGSKIP